MEPVADEKKKNRFLPYTGRMEGPLPVLEGQRDYLLLICWGNVGAMTRGNCWLPEPNKRLE